MNIRTVIKCAAVAASILLTPLAKAEPGEKDFTPEFVAQCKAKAEAGDAEGQALYGQALSRGWGVEKDEAKAVEWYRKAAEQGLARAQCNLGFCYYNGTGVEKDEAKAVEWCRKAAEQGDADAQMNLGFFYQKGKGVEKDEAKAVEWYRKGVESYRKDAEQGDADAQSNLGFCYEYGTGVEKDEAKAVEWYRKAAEQGSELARLAMKRLLGEQGEKAAVPALMEKAKKMDEETFVVNGFYVGMPIEDAVKLVEALLPDRKISRSNSDAENLRGIWFDDESQPFCIEKNGVVTTIQIPKDLVKAWLNLKAYSYDDWAKKFATMHNLELTVGNFSDYVSRGGSSASFDQTFYNFGVLKGCQIKYFGKNEGKYRKGDDLAGLMYVAGWVTGKYLSLQIAKEGTLQISQAEEL